jgi:Acyl-CoA carboxylase epsilon subunit
VNRVSDGNETNGQSTESDDVNDAAPAAEVAVAHDPVIQVHKGEPTAEELAALIAVLGAAGGGGGAPAAPEATRWGLPVDKLRYAPFSWQKITLLGRTHMRR